MNSRTGEITQLLEDLRSGDKNAQTQLFPLVYNELRRIAAGFLRGERSNHTLQPTALVHEAYLRLVSQKDQNWESRAHFLGIAAHLMRQVLVDHARKRHAIKRGGHDQPVTLEDFAVARGHRPVHLLALDEALKKLEKEDPLQSKIVELKFFGGLTFQEIVKVLERICEPISERTAKREWNLARLWLYAELTK